MEKLMKLITLMFVMICTAPVLAMQKQVIPLNTITTPHYPQHEEPKSQSMYNSNSQQRRHQAKEIDVKDCCFKAAQYTTTTVAIIVCGIPAAIAFLASEYCCDEAGASDHVKVNMAFSAEMG
jgi:hypothetical protein